MRSKMAKAPVVALITIAFCFSFLSFAFAHTHKPLTVEGNVYCDTCRVEFVTKLSQPIKGATVRLECRNPITNMITYNANSVTDESGKYSINVQGHHGYEICEVRVLKSPREDCNAFMEEWRKARVQLSTKAGVSESVRYANSLGFVIQKALPECDEVLKELGVLSL